MRRQMKQFLFVVPLVELNICVCACARVYASAWHRRDTHKHTLHTSSKKGRMKQRKKWGAERSRWVYIHFVKQIDIRYMFRPYRMFIHSLVRSLLFIYFVACLLTCSLVRSFVYCFHFWRWCLHGIRDPLPCSSHHHCQHIFCLHLHMQI